MSGKSVTVKFRSISLTILPWKHPSGRQYFRCAYHRPRTGQRMFLTRSTMAKAKADVLRLAQELANDATDLSALRPDQMRAVQRLMDADPTLEIIDEFLLWRSKAKPEKPTAPAVVEFLALKESNAGLSTQNVRTLRKHLAPLADLFGDRFLSAIAVQDLESYLSSNPKNGNRTRRNIRASLVTFFRWCRTMEYLPDGTTAAERTSTPIVEQTIPETYSPDQLRIILDHVRPEFLPWLAIAAFAGVRTDEISPIAGSRKRPLDWSDFHWDRDLIIIHPKTAKTKRRRVVPILPALRSWLWSSRQNSGPVHTAIAPTKRPKGPGAQSETVRLGRLIGGWKPNAIRHSFISYRAALVGLGQTAMEAGNSESEAKASYNDAKGADEASRWFSVFPECSQNPG